MHDKKLKQDMSHLKDTGIYGIRLTIWESRADFFRKCDSIEALIHLLSKLGVWEKETWAVHLRGPFDWKKKE